MLNKALRCITAALTAMAALLTLTPAAHASGHRTTTFAAVNYSCRSATAGNYWHNGVESDACDGPIADGTFGGEAITGMDSNGAINDNSGSVTSCTVQLNHVVNGTAYPVPGANYTQYGQDPTYFDGHYCDAMDAWRPAAGYYNVTTSYVHNGSNTVTVQGPVKYYGG